MRSKPTAIAFGALSALILLGAQAQNAPAPAEGPKVGPYAVPKHWSKYKYPESVPEGSAYHIIEKGDTLWDLAQRYLKNPLLWPQIWNDNKYIRDAHWIYPGDPLILKQVDMVADKAGQTPELPADDSAAGADAARSRTGEGPTENPLYPAIQALTMQCAASIAPQKEDQSLKVVGSEQGRGKVAFGERDILYLNKGSNAGLKPGDVLSLHAPQYTVKHPKSHKTVGTHIATKGWVRVLLVQETSATAVIEQSCSETLAGDYLKPFERVSVPLLLRRPPSDRLTPSSGKATGYVLDIGDDAVSGGVNHLVIVDVGSQAGAAPGNLMTVFRHEYPKLPSSRNVIGELAILSVKEGLALAKINYSAQEIIVGDQVELR